MRLIDADALKANICELQDGDKGRYTVLCEVFREINLTPTVDAVKVTRCNECRFGYLRGGWTTTEYRCHKFPSDIFSGDHFCAWGKPRPEEDE